MNERLTNDLYYWCRRIRPCESSGIRLSPDDCYRLGLVLECACDGLLQLKSELDIERSNNRVLDPEGSRLRMELQRKYGTSPFEEAPRGPRSRLFETEDEAGKSVFRNL